MKVHITCSHPSRSLVLAVHAARELLRSCGHEVGVSWPESWLEDGDFRRTGLNRKVLNDSELIVHVSSPDEIDLPSELTACLRFGTPVVRYDALSLEDEVPDGEATVRVNRAEQLVEAVREACRLTVG
jgi:hypothetical protein